MWLTSQYSITKAYLLSLPGWRTTKLHQMRSTKACLLEKTPALDLDAFLMQIYLSHATYHVTL